MHGPLSEIGLIEVLQLLERGRRSGVLRVTGADADEPRHLRLAEGAIVALEPDAGDAATRAALVQRFLVSHADAESDHGILSREPAMEVRCEIAVQALSDMLHWRRGRFDFEAAPVEGGPLSLSPESMVFRMVASESRRLDLGESMADFLAVPEFASSELLTLGPIPQLTPRDWRLLDLVDGERNVATIAAAMHEPLEDIAACIQSLVATTILELRQPVPDPAMIARSA